ncbi:E4 SUMO-protein ligase PIAL1-like isoform X2 [Brassica napus]|uniref:E4 SUMO-protein ligase PIAL1-like isoform X2 n=1 Tax=Brassica napus TaxID=3708 RepID=UPI002078C127|nr:E4 SUMO-protein ligase PIAL1-like isoform X2 [Brassica napus]
MVIPPSSRLNHGTEVGSKEFHAYCFSLANRIDDAIGKDEVPLDVQDLAITLDHVCQQRCNDQTRAVIMTLMISVKTACRLGWFPQRESQHLLGLVDSMLKDFTSPEDVASSVNSPISLIPQVMERFYPFFKLGHILVSFEAKAESNILAKDFHISKKMLQHSPQAKVGLFVFRAEDISKSSCLIHPQEVSFLLNGEGVEKRYNALMEPGPQCPTDVTSLLNLGANLLQTVGCFGGSYFIVIALLDDIPLPVNPSLKDYVHSEVTESNLDCDIIEGPSRISLSCPISRTRIKLPVKGRVCKHLQCFDFWNYVEINTRIPSWRCPHCNQPVCYTDIRLDQIMIKILEEVGRYATDVVISADGSWKVLTESNKNVEAVPEATQGDPNSFQKLTPTVLDLTSDENEMETSGGTQFNEQKPCLSEIHNTHTPVMGYPLLNQSSASVNALPQLPQTFNVFDGQQRFTNFPQVVNRQDSAAREALYPEDRLATNTTCFHIPMPAAQSSQFQGSHVTPLGHSLGRASGYNHIYDNGITQTHMPPPLHHQYAMQRLHTRRSRSPSPAQERQIPSGITHHQRLFANYGGTSYQRLMQRPVQRLNPVGAGQQFPWRELTNMNRMRGSLTPGSTGYEHMIIQPTRPVHAPAQTLAQPQTTAYNYIPAQAQVQTLPPPQPTSYHSMADEIQAFLAHPSYPNGNTGTQARTGSLPVEKGVGPTGLLWSMPPEAW